MDLREILEGVPLEDEIGSNLECHLTDHIADGSSGPLPWAIEMLTTKHPRDWAYGRKFECL